jgi:hypothetical protein
MAIGDVGGNSSNKKPPISFVSKLAWFTVVVGLFAGARYIVKHAWTSISIEARRLSGQGWEGARAEVEAGIRSSVRQNIGQMKLSTEEFEALVQCEVSGQIAWLNSSGCSYEYNTGLTKRDDHLLAQDACLKKAGSVQKMAEIDLACTKAHFPNSWKTYEVIFADTFTESLSTAITVAQTARTVGECVSRKYVVELENSGCKPMNLNAATAEGLFGDQSCVESRRAQLDDRTKTFADECVSVVLRSGP